jgi:hypothetical protein
VKVDARGHWIKKRTPDESKDDGKSSEEQRSHGQISSYVRVIDARLNFAKP